MLSRHLTQAARDLEGQVGSGARCHVRVEGEEGDHLFLVAIEGTELAVRMAWSLACDQPHSRRVIITLPNGTAPLMAFAGQQESE
jgi:hypothetical protein